MWSIIRYPKLCLKQECDIGANGQRRRRSVFLQKETGESDNIAIFMSTVNQPIHPMFKGRE